MKIDSTLVDKLANLAKLEFTAAEHQAIRADLEAMVDFVEQISEVDTDGVAPLVFLSDGINATRSDKATAPLSSEDVFRNAPAREGNYFVVPTVIRRPNS